MRTLVVSDLHLGGRTGADVLRRPAALEGLLEALEGVDRLVLLGDVVELRHGPLRAALAEARPVLERIGQALEDGEVVLVPGNHDHVLARRWLEERRQHADAEPLGLAHSLAPAAASDAAEELARWLGAARVTVSYPGIWLRDDVYATHGHYLDRHITIPTFERLAAGAMTRVVGAVPRRATPDDYEAALAPLYAWMHAVAQGTAPEAIARGAGSSAKAWRLLTADGRRPLRARALAAGFPAIIAALNRAGLGPLRADVSGAELRRAGLRALAEALARLEVRAAHVIFGHTHRPGPLPGDDPGEWRAPHGVRLHNAGSWVYQRQFVAHGGSANPYWPGTAILLDGDGPPSMLRLLAERTHADLA